MDMILMPLPDRWLGGWPAGDPPLLLVGRAEVLVDVRLPGQGVLQRHHVGQGQRICDLPAAEADLAAVQPVHVHRAHVVVQALRRRSIRTQMAARGAVDIHRIQAGIDDGGADHPGGLRRQRLARRRVARVVVAICDPRAPIDRASGDQVGDMIGFRALLRGQPMGGQLVYASFAGFQGQDAQAGRAVKLRTDAEGRGSFKVTQTGVWYVTLINMQKAMGEATYESNWSTVTFEIR